MEGTADEDIIQQWKRVNVNSQMHIETVLSTGSLVVVATCINVLDPHEQNRPWALFPPVVYPGMAGMAHAMGATLTDAQNVLVKR